MESGARIHRISFVIIFICLSALPLEAEKLDFSLMDSHGREVSSQDYKGVPVFVEFGACW